MKTFEEALKVKIKQIPEREKCAQDTCNEVFDDGFEQGAKWARNSPEQIIKKYHEWSDNIMSDKIALWAGEEVNWENTKARIRKEFIEYLNKQNK